MKINQGYLLTRHHESKGSRQDLVFWLNTEEGPFRLVIEDQASVCFVLQSDMAQISRVLTGSDISWNLKAVKLSNFQHQPVAALYCGSQIMQRQAVNLIKRYGVNIWEEDIQPTERYLMERNIQAGLKWSDSDVKPARTRFIPKLKSISLDIETSAWSPEATPDLYSISMTMKDYRWTGILKASSHKTLVTTSEVFVAGSVHELLTEFLVEMHQQDPDLIVGWNVINFDFRVLQYWFDHEHISFAAGRAGSILKWRQPDPEKNQWFVSTEGRVVLDGIDVLRSSFNFFEDYSLNAVSSQLLNQEKLITDEKDKVAEIKNLYLQHPEKLVAYNIQDCLLVESIFEALKLYDFLIERSYLSGLPIDRMGGSAAAFNNLYLPRLHRKGFVAPSVGTQALQFSSPGGYVFDSIPGLYDQILVLDFKSLYPSIILTFLIDPLGLILAQERKNSDPVPGFDGGVFDKSDHILPALIEQLWRQRDDAKQEKNSSLSQAIKILMNSFYGVLGSNLCRFYDPRLASSITKRGHQIMVDSKTWIEGQGYTVIYGDTDSLFVHINHPLSSDDLNTLGHELALKLNQYWQQQIKRQFALENHLEIEFETCYQRFLMPTIRNTEKGSKKRYAGMLLNSDGNNELVFKGLEAVRTDWSPLAKQFQVELYRRVFEQREYKQWIIDFVEAVWAGEKDSLLVFKRRVKKTPQEYASGLPPSAQAVVQLQRKYPGRRFNRVEYVITVNGVEAVEMKLSRLDYDFYVTRQIKPIADAILCFLGDDFDSIVSHQISLL